MKITLSLIILFFSFCLFGQITDIKYQLKFDSIACQYDMMIEVTGNASSSTHRLFSEGFITLVVPAGTLVTMTNDYMPLLNNSTYAGTTPVNWEVVESITNPSEMPGFTVHSISTVGFSTAWFNNLGNGNMIRLFSFTVPSINEVRLYDNQTDPNTLNNLDFKHSFKIGITSMSLYSVNLENISPSMIIEHNCPNKVYIHDTLQVNTTYLGQWSSSAPQVADVNADGRIVALSEGNCTITFTTAACGVNDPIDLEVVSAASATPVGIGTTSPKPSAALDITSTHSGLLLPRMTKGQRLDIPSPTPGLMVYQLNDAEGVYIYTSNGWKKLKFE